MKQAFKKIFNYKFHTKVFLNPFINFQKKNLGVNKDGRDLPVIISLTSYQDRFKCLPKTLYSLFNQDLKADRVILWVDKNSIYQGSSLSKLKESVSSARQWAMVRSKKS